MDPLLIEAADLAFVWQNRWFVLLGTLVTAFLTLAAVGLGFVVGILAAVVEVYGEGRLRTGVSTAGVLLRATPIVVLIVLFFFGLPIPSLGRVPVLEVKIDAFVAAALALGLRSGAYQSQVFRGAIESVDEGQIEAARAVGLSTVEAVRHVVLPQALRRSVPGFQNEFTIALKDTSVAFAIGLAELLTRGFRLFTQPGREGTVMEVILVISLVYFVLTFATNRTLDRLGARYAIPGGT